MNIHAIVPLDAESLITAAVRHTGLDDFGVDDWREPFEALCRSLEEDSRLNLLGRIRTRSELLLLLEARLQIEDEYTRHPEIDQQSIVKPLFIIGQGRSGTSYLLNLLASNSDNGAIMTWEATFPCPPPEKAKYKTDPRIERAHLLADQCNRVTPELVSMHEFSGRIPQDCSQILGLSFRTEGWFNVMGRVDAYNRYMGTADPEPAYRYHKRVLKLLQWKNPRQRWILKDPTHLDKLDTILRVYPDACFIWPHRDPVKALASTVDLLGTMLWNRSDHAIESATWQAYMDPIAAARRLTDIIDLFESGTLPSTQLYNVLYRDLARIPLETVAGIHEYFGLPFGTRQLAQIKHYLDCNPRTLRPAHTIQKDTARGASAEREAFKRYREYFGVPDE